MKSRVDEDQLLIDRMIRQDEQAILEGIHAESSLLNLNAVIQGAKLKIKNEDFVFALIQLLDSHKVAPRGVELQPFVEAALDVLGVKEYKGDNRLIRDLIVCEFNI